MSIEQIGWARLALRQQVEILRRRPGEPGQPLEGGGEPGRARSRRWSELAAPLLAGFSAYLDRLDGGAESDGRSVAAVVDLGGRIEGPLAHRRPHEPRVHRLDLRNLSR